jgi:hypothetical protein
MKSVCIRDEDVWELKRRGRRRKLSPKGIGGRGIDNPDTYYRGKTQ